MITSETQMIYYWKMRPLNSLTREELLEAAIWMAKELDRLGQSSNYNHSTNRFWQVQSEL